MPEHSQQLTLNDVSLEVGSKPLVQRVNLSLSSNGATAIMGFNGAGKSLLLKLMHGIVQPSAGTVLWGGHTSTAEHRLAQAMVFQKPVLLRRSVKANMDFVLKQRRWPDTALRQHLLEQVDLLPKLRQPARLLSGGEQQRLALARALACKPAVLFLDEATASLDPASTAIIERIVAKEAQNGTKVIFITHDAAHAARLAQDIVFMDAGKVAEYSNANTFFTQPTSAAAQAYLSGQLYVGQNDVGRSEIKPSDIGQNQITHSAPVDTLGEN